MARQSHRASCTRASLHTPVSSSVRAFSIIMTILITGSSGKVAQHLVVLLKPSHRILIASRSGTTADGIAAVNFDWTDQATFATPFSHPCTQGSSIKAIYLVSQRGVVEPFDAMRLFTDTAKAHGVERFVLVSSIREDETTQGRGKVHAYLKALDVEWAVLRPTWFMGKVHLVKPQPTNSSMSQRISPSCIICPPSGTSRV